MTKMSFIAEPGLLHTRAMEVLLIEDERRTGAFIVRALEAQGIEVATAEDGRDGLARALRDRFDLVVLDLMLPGVDGLTLLRELRARKPELPVLIVSARADLETKLRGFDLGADDYLVKPFAVDELVARVRAHLRRSGAIESDIVRAGPLALDVARREVRVSGTLSKLTDLEFRLLHHLAGRPGQIVSREQLLSVVWGYDFDPRSNVVDVGIRRLRKKLGPDAPIETVRNVGYRLVAAA
jgi:DNA-binding response OmpR family regulator